MLMKRFIIFLPFLAFALLFSLQSCGDENTVVTYTTDIEPIMTNRCITCHSGSTPSGNLLLTNYAEVRAAAEAGNLTTRINDNTNPMPPSGLIPSDQRTTIQDWVNGGFLE